MKTGQWMFLGIAIATLAVAYVVVGDRLLPGGPAEPVAAEPAAPPPRVEEPPSLPLASAPDLGAEMRVRRQRRLDDAWATVQRLVAAGSWKEAQEAYARLRALDVAFADDPARAKVAARIQAALDSERSRATLEKALERARISEGQRDLLEGRLAATAEILARSANPQDLDVLTRHLQRFLLPQGAASGGGEGEALLRQFVEDRRARRQQDKNPPVASADEAEQRRLDQLEKLRQRDAVGLLDYIHSALAWLAIHQRDDGSFSDKAVEERCAALKHEPKNCLGDAGSTGENYATACTALAAIAFLDFRDQDIHGWFDPYLGRAIQWLVKNQRPNGSFPGSGQQYATAMAVMALGQAAASTGDPAIKEACKKGIDWFNETQGPLGGFRYGPYDTRGDLSVTGWVAQAVEGARVAKVPVPPKLENGLELYMRYVWLGDHRFAYQNGGGESWALSPVGMLLGHLMWTQKDPKVIEEWKKHLASWPPNRRPDLYALYYGVRLSILLTGALEDPWRAWSFDLAKAQIRGTTAAGSFPITVWRRSSGVAVSTALAVLTLEHALYLR